MKEIKFRAWDKEKKWMFFVSDLHAPERNNHFMEKEGCDLMQFTGLKDKNENEIYDGDILKWIKGGVCGKVELRKGCFELVTLDSGGSYIHLQQATHRIAIDCLDLEVIGNIYENPELLVS